MLAWSKLLLLTGKKLAFGVYSLHIWISAPSPYIHLASTQVMNETRTSPFFCHSSVSMYYTERKVKNKNGRGLGTRLVIIALVDLLCLRGASTSVIKAIPEDMSQVLLSLQSQQGYTPEC